jgi:hypothetical protein
MSRLLLICTLLIFILNNCRKNNYEPKPSDIGQNYLPLAIGKVFIYKSDSVKYGFTGNNAQGDSIKFYIKEEVISKMEDSLKTTFIISRFHGKDTINWQFVKNHFYEVEKFRVNHSENNVIKTSLVFPVELYYYWNGHQLNNLGAKEYEYSMVNFNFKQGQKSFSNCLKVKIDSISNLRERKIVSEIFSHNHGLVFTENINVSLINNDSLDSKGNIVLKRPPKIEKGIIFTKLLINTK